MKILAHAVTASKLRVTVGVFCFATPLFMSDSPEGNKGNDQDERMKLKNSSSVSATEREKFIMHLEN